MPKSGTGPLMRTAALVFTALITTSGVTLADVMPLDVIWTGDVEAPVSALVVSPDGARVAVGTDASDAAAVQLRLFHARSGRLLQSVALGSPVAALAFAVDGQSIFAACRDRRVRQLVLPEGPLHEFEIPEGQGLIYDIAASPDGRYLAVSGVDSPTLLTWIHVIDIETGAAFGRIGPHQRPTLCLRFSADGESLLAGGAEGSIRVWSFPDGTLMDVIEPDVPEPDLVRVMALSRDSKTLIFGADLSGVHRVSRGRGHSVTRCGRLDDWVLAVAFTPDERYFAAASTLASGPARVGIVRTWEAASGEAAATLAPPDGAGVRALAFVPSSGLMAVGTHSGQVHVARDPHWLAGDFDDNGCVGAEDLMIVLGNLGCSGEACKGDANLDQRVDQDDLDLALEAFSMACR